jgi:serine/threonine protein kinase
MPDPSEADDPLRSPDQDDPLLVQWAAELAERIQAGEEVDLEALASQHPERAARLRRLLPTIRLMANLRDEPSTSPMPAVLGDFRILREIGRGGMGIVYEAEQITLKRRVALKVLPAISALDAKRFRRFQIEAQAVALLGHPNIVPIYAVGCDQGYHYYAMQLVIGGSLAERVKELRGDGDSASAEAEVPGLTATASRNASDRAETASTRPPARNRTYFDSVARLGIQAAEALGYAHDRGVVHRDIKPSNLLVDEAGKLWLTDFGLARIGDGGDLTASGDQLGTLRYMSPEQVRRQNVPVDRRTDIYSLGATLYELLALRPAVEGDERGDLVRRILEEEPTPLRVLDRTIPKDLETIVLKKAMAKDFNDRYALMAKLADDLKRYLRREPILPDAPMWKRAIAWAKRHRSRLTKSAMIAAPLLGASGAWWGAREFEERGEAELWLNRLESAIPARLPELLRRSPADRRVSGPLAEMFVSSRPGPKLAAALALSPGREDCSRFAYDRLLVASPDELAPIGQALVHARPAVVGWLKLAAGTPADRNAAEPDRERHDRRRANAAAILVLIGEVDAGLRLLEFTPDPQARSYLIQTLGPSGVRPALLLAKLTDRATQPDVRRALLQALGFVPESLWEEGTLGEAVEIASGCYRDDPDSGVHGSAKWLLLRHGKVAELRKLDEALKANADYRPGFRWRVSRSGLTFVKVDGELGAVFEISDAEVSRELCVRLRPGHEFAPNVLAASPESDCPVVGINYIGAAGLLNALTDAEGGSLGPDARSYSEIAEDSPDGVVDRPGRAGYRVPTDREFAFACRAGTETTRYYGDSLELLREYAWFDRGKGMRTQPIGRLLPNDLGLFDTLGNAAEICRLSDAPPDSRLRAVACGGSAKNPDHVIRWDRAMRNAIYQQEASLIDVGFRVARTIGRP